MTKTTRAIYYFCFFLTSALFSYGVFFPIRLLYESETVPSILKILIAIIWAAAGLWTIAYVLTRHSPEADRERKQIMQSTAIGWLIAIVALAGTKLLF